MPDWRYQPAADAGLPLTERARSLKRESGLIESAGHIGWWVLARSYLWLYHRLAVRGLEHIPKQPPFVLVANHASHLDALVLGARLPWRLRDRIFPIAAGDTFFEVPAVSLLAAGFINALPLWREKVGPKALLELRRRLLEEPCAYILFPEGTRSRDGSMAGFKAGMGMIVAGAEVPVVPCHISGAFEALPPERKLPRPRKLTLTIGPPLSFAALPNRREGWEQVARQSEAAVRALASPLPQGEAARTGSTQA